MRKTKIVCTLGPASNNEETLTAMCKAGMNVARLNFSHGDYAQHQRKIDMVKSVSQDRAVIVRNKQKSIGDVAAYGFGYYLFENLSKSNVDSIKWIDAYSKKSAFIDGSNKLVGEAEKVSE